MAGRPYQKLPEASVQAIQALQQEKLRPAKYTDLDSSVFKWFTQHGVKGIAVSVDSIRNAAERLAVKLNIDNFKASTEWVCQFKERLEKSIPSCKVKKERISALLCCNADGSHRTKCAIVGKSANLRALKNCMNRLPVIYYNTKNAWFTQIIFEDWFQNHFCKEVKKQQINMCRIHPTEVKAMLLTDNAPAHPTAKLRSLDGKITCMALPPNTTSVIQPWIRGYLCSQNAL
nr:tigger transposable element-derived protein 7-like [Procambarus clarkii]